MQPYSRSEAEDISGPLRVLLAEDDDEMRSMLAQAFRQEGLSVTLCANGGELLYFLRGFLLEPGARELSDEFDLIVSDIRMPLVSGLEILKGMHDIPAFPPMILITAFGDRDTHEYASRLGVAAILDKPFEIDELLATIRDVGLRNA